ncbi:hypothetical protein EVAR_59180_1 [Eumeta japonica]|uniref:Uncharacterized protein n=1 Tax=Eumeta variegata TaxID=151549 RepID=A0A4C1ZJB8_EUMVA|nr:hypothetical protein EVAR_59180_1 [Eumeta japonica]
MSCVYMQRRAPDCSDAARDAFERDYCVPPICQPPPIAVASCATPVFVHSEQTVATRPPSAFIPSLSVAIDEATELPNERRFTMGRPGRRGSPPRGSVRVGPRRAVVVSTRRAGPGAPPTPPGRRRPPALYINHRSIGVAFRGKCSIVLTRLTHVNHLRSCTFGSFPVKYGGAGARGVFTHAAASGAPAAPSPVNKRTFYSAACYSSRPPEPAGPVPPTSSARSSQRQLFAARRRREVRLMTLATPSDVTTQRWTPVSALALPLCTRGPRAQHQGYVRVVPYGDLWSSLILLGNRCELTDKHILESLKEDQIPKRKLSSTTGAGGGAEGGGAAGGRAAAFTGHAASALRMRFTAAVGGLPPD